MKLAGQKTVEDELYVIGLWFLGIGSIAFIMYYFVLMPYLPRNACIFWNLLGAYCPGCGGTRAVSALLHGRILTSLWYHPLVIYTVVMYGGYMISHTLERLRVGRIKGWKFHNWYLYTALVIVIVNWIVKNILLLKFNITL